MLFWKVRLLRYRRATRIHYTLFMWVGKGHRSHAYLIENKRTSQGGPTGVERENRWESPVGFQRWCFFCFVYLEFIVPLENCPLIWRRHHYRWRAANFAIGSALKAIEQWGFLKCHTHCDTGLPFTMVISEDPWHSNRLRSVWRCSCLYLFLHIWNRFRVWSLKYYHFYISESVPFHSR